MMFRGLSRPVVAGGFTLLLLCVIAAVLQAVSPNYAAVGAGQADAGYLESADCRKCHETNYTSWHQTFHRTMTQEAGPESVLGDFEHNNTITYQGVRAVMTREGDGYWMNVTGADGRTERLQVVRTVGSRRIQQYLSKSGDKWIRAPIAYDLMQRRWMHLNGSFFYPDGSPYTQHVAEWNMNCVFCHNVKAQPGLDWDKGTWSTEVAELGIACGACHGPAGAHAQAALSPLKRYQWRLQEGDAPPRLVVNPAKVDTDRAAMICGHCHGQRVPEPLGRIRSMMSKGDAYDAGENLHEFYRPVQRETKVETFSFASRFWEDGSPRLTAFEYQGLTRSKCFTAGEPGNRLTCISCHSMHGGDPRGQITAKMKTNAACTQCHQEFTEAAQLVAHTKHDAQSTGSSCYECHMPKIVYGIMSAHRTHDITIPRPDETIRFNKPNACNQCHLDWSANHTIAETRRLWPKEYAASQPGGEFFDEPEGQRALFAGDAVVRALTAGAMAVAPTADAFAPFLFEALQDNYPIVRYFAANALAGQQPTLPKPDYLVTADRQHPTLQMWKPLWSEERRNAAREARERLSVQRSATDVEVGE